MFVKPAEGRVLRDPLTMLVVPETGMSVPDHDPHWAQLIRHGDATVVPEPVEAEAEGHAAAPAPAVEEHA